jgi:transposase
MRLPWHPDMLRKQRMSNRIRELEQTVERLQKQVEHLTAALEQAHEIIERQQKELEQLREEKRILHRRLHGPKSDRPSDEAQLLLSELFATLGDEDEGKEDEEEPEPTQEANQSSRPAKKRKAHAKRLSLVGTGLEERVEVAEPDPAKVTDPSTGERYPIIDYEETRRLAEQPRKIYVRVIRRPIYRVPSELTGTTLVSAPAPDDNPIERCKADVTLLASLLCLKYVLHLSLYRVQEIYHQATGMWIARSTLCGWVSGCALALEPIVKLMRRLMMEKDYIGLDDTSVCKLAPGTGSVEVDKLWAYTCVLEEAPYTVYDFTPSREARHPLAFIPESFRGYIQGDACSSHDRLMQREGVVEVGCWDHARRYFADASDNDPWLCAEALTYIRRLYRVERRAAALSPEERRAMRQEISAPILTELKAWVDKTAKDPFLKATMRSALTYVTNQWEALNVYLKDGRIPISNIHTERAMRGVGIGRKNWLFVGSEAGGQSLATILSLVTTCRNLGIDTRAYFTDVLARVNTHPHSRLEELLPDQWKRLQEQAGRKVTQAKRPEWRKRDQDQWLVDAA